MNSKNGPLKMKKLVLYVRKDGFVQHYHVAEHDTAEHDAILDPGALPGIPDIPNDRILRYSSPSSIVNATIGRLQPTDPLPRHIPRIYLPDTHAVQVYLGRRKRSYNMAAVLDSRAAYIGDAILILPKTYRDLQGNVAQRAAAARTISHEYWHALKGYVRGFHPLEEGGADLYADRFSLSVLGADLSGRASYPLLRDAVAALEGRLGKAWLKKSRKAPNQHRYLEQGLNQLRVSDADRAQVLRYTQLGEQEQFHNAVMRLLEKESG